MSCCGEGKLKNPSQGGLQAGSRTPDPAVGQTRLYVAARSIAHATIASPQHEIQQRSSPTRHK